LIEIKSSGQSGETSYGKLGETTIQARCPSCQQAAELRGTSENGSSVYHCNSCGTAFSVDAITRNTSQEPKNNVPSPETPRVGEEPALAIEGKSVKLSLKKGDDMTEIAKAKKEAEAEAEACNRSKDAEAEGDAEYKKFKEFMQRYKAEGVDTVPGSENAKPSSTISHESYGGAAHPVHGAKSVKDYESMQKAFVENAGSEGLAKEAPAEVSSPVFKSMREDFMRRK